jgi:hypothetical protein
MTKTDDDMYPTIIEAAARALHDDPYIIVGGEEVQRLACSIVAAVTPLIRAAALEEVALRIEADEEDYLMRMDVAAAIRTLKEQP